MMKLRLASPGVLVDIGRIADLRPDRARRRPGRHRNPARTLRSPRPRSSANTASRCWPGRPASSASAGRHRGTIGGSLAHADPKADHPLAAVAGGATMVVQGPQGGREIAADDFSSSATSPPRSTRTSCSSRSASRAPRARLGARSWSRGPTTGRSSGGHRRRTDRPGRHGGPAVAGPGGRGGARGRAGRRRGGPAGGRGVPSPLWIISGTGVPGASGPGADPSGAAFGRGLTRPARRCGEADRG